MDPVRIDRQDFLANYWDYTPGEHTTFLGPTGSGKTQMKWQLLAYTATPKHPAIVLATKPKDVTTSRWMRYLQYEMTRGWPPPWNPSRLTRGKPAGRVLWPRHSFDPDIDEKKHPEIIRRAILDLYRKGDQMLDVDEVLDLVDMKLEKVMRTVWTRGRSMKLGFWAGTQQPFHVPTHMYRQAEHLFIAKDPDRRSRERYDEIGGVDSGLVREWVMSLRKFEFLYLRRTGPEVAVIGK